uniref:hypothetical protein n=1 Tax=Cellvibrio fontiphilus TaxID=1815559 RepID=UPI002B4BDA22|nr:hypothetical protein [Cellvibrio fontiphilus]
MPDMSGSPLWQHQSTDQTELYYCKFSGVDQTGLKHAVEACATKAVELLHRNIQDESLFLLFEWNPGTAQLRAVVTDTDKKIDSPCVVLAELGELVLPATADIASNIQFLLSDFLASYSPFFRYSLVAMFHSGSRAATTLL